MSARRKLFILALLSGALLVPSVVLAKGVKIAPLTPTFNPEKAEEITSRFQDAIAEGLEAAKIPTLGAKQVRTKITKACGAAACAERSRGRLGVSHVVYGRVDTVGKNYTIELSLQPGALRVAGRCDICTLMEALSTTRKLATKLGSDNRAALLAPSPRAASKKPAPRAAPPPKAEKKRPAAQKKPPVDPEDKPTPPPAKASTARKAWPLWPSLVAAGAGVLGLAIGIPLLSMDGDFTNCRGDPLPDGRNCADRYSTSGGGWAFTTMGLAGLAAGGVLFYLYLSSRQERKAAWQRPASGWQQVMVTPTRNGLLLNAGGAF